jgi:alkanesulfonate monooxygenase
MSQFRARAAVFGRKPRANVSVRPIIAVTEGSAWDKADRILAAMTGGKKGWRPVDNTGKRLTRSAMELNVYDERLWMPIARATGAVGNSSSSSAPSSRSRKLPR